MAQLENIEAIERRLWTAADTLRANSNYASNEYFMPVMGLIFLRHAYSRYLAVKPEIEAALPSRGGVTRPLTKEDFSQRGAIFLQPEAQFDYLVSLPANDTIDAVIGAMESIEGDYETLKGALPKQEYQELSPDVLSHLLRILNPEELKRADGDIFGRIYEYFLTQFADQKAHDGGEFFTPVSLVSLIANVLEPSHGVVFDPACGSGGMFVQSARFVEQRLHENPSRKLTFRGLEKNGTTINLARMNLAVHGLEGDIRKAITYYDDHAKALTGKADYVMANPPFNVDEVDAKKTDGDPRLPFGLPGVNKGGKVSNANYLWIQYFHAYLNEAGRAGFVMSSQASSAGRDEAKVRQKLVESGDVDLMVAIRSNFFYTRTVPCELWFLNRAKPEAHRDRVLMLDARNVYRKVTRKIYDFSPEQLQNLLAIVWLYRGDEERFLELVAGYLERAVAEGQACFSNKRSGEMREPLGELFDACEALLGLMKPFVCSLAEEGAHAALLAECEAALRTFEQDTEALGDLVTAEAGRELPREAAALVRATAALAPLAEATRDLGKQADHLFKLCSRLGDLCEKELDARASDLWPNAQVGRARKAADAARHAAVEQLRQLRYFHRQAVWLTDRFPEGRLRDVEGLVRLVDRAELERNDWSLTPGRYVGVAPEEVDEEFDFEEVLREIHVELRGLNEEATELAVIIDRSFEEMA